MTKEERRIEELDARLEAAEAANAEREARLEAERQWAARYEAERLARKKQDAFDEAWDKKWHPKPFYRGPGIDDDSDDW